VKIKIKNKRKTNLLTHIIPNINAKFSNFIFFKIKLILINPLILRAMKVVTKTKLIALLDLKNLFIQDTGQFNIITSTFHNFLYLFILDC